MQSHAPRSKTDDELTEEELMLASPVLYGFSLSDKIWRESRSVIFGTLLNGM